MHWSRVVLAFTLALSALLVGCKSAPDKMSLALDWFPWSNHAPLYMARDRGYFKDGGLDLNIYTPSDPSTVLQTVGAGRDQFGISYQPEVLLARAQGIPVVSIAALVQHPLNSVMALKESGIARPRDLKGKKIGWPGIPYNEPMVRTMLEKDGLTMNDVTLVNVGFDLVPALISKQVDAVTGAYWVHESIDAENQGHPVNWLRMEQWGVPDYYELVLVTNESMVRDHPDQVEAFVKAAIRGYREAAQDPRGAVAVEKRLVPELDLAIENPGVDLLAPLWTDGGKVAPGWQEEARWKAFADYLKANNQLDSKVDPSAAFTNRFVAEAKGK